MTERKLERLSDQLLTIYDQNKMQQQISNTYCEFGDLKQALLMAYGYFRS